MNALSILITRYSILLVCWLSLSLAASAFSFAVFGDNHGNQAALDRLIDKLNAEKGLAFAVNLGDFVLNGREDEYAEYVKRIARLKMPVYQVQGNHDGMNGGWRVFNKYFGPAYYSFDHEDAHFIVLDNSFRQSFDARQFAWLKADLAASRARRKFVFMHKPAFDPSELYAGYVMSGRATTEELERLFEKYRVAYVFAGHIHGYARARVNGVTYIITAGAGAPLYLPPEFGGFYNYVIMSVDKQRVRDRVERLYD